MTAANAFNDILYNDRFIGAIEKISWLTGLMDKVFVQIITVVAYLIISMPILKNALNGAYVAFPKAFDAVDEIKSGWGSSDGGGIGLAKRVLAFFIPNIKSLTDFTDGTKSAKAYFTTSLIQLIITVLIGVLIYNGVYRDLIGEGAKVGQHFIVNVVLAQDYTQAMDDLIGAGKNYSFTRSKVEGAGGTKKDGINKAIYDRVKQAWPGTISTLTTDMLQSIGARIENHMERLYRNDAGDRPLGEYFGNESYSITSGVDLSPSEEFINTDTYPRGGKWIPDDMGGGTYCFSATVSELGAGDGVNTSWVKDGRDHSKYTIYGQIVIVQRSTTISTTSGLAYVAEFTVGGGVEAKTQNGKTTYKWNLGAMNTDTYGFESRTLNGAATYVATVNGTQVTASVFYNKGDNSFYMVWDSANDANRNPLMGATWSRQSGALNYGETGEYRPIATFSLKSTSGGNMTAATFKDTGDVFEPFAYGQVPVAKTPS